jgi:hypothetical protein
VSSLAGRPARRWARAPAGKPAPRFTPDQRTLGRVAIQPGESGPENFEARADFTGDEEEDESDDEPDATNHDYDPPEIGLGDDSAS